MTTIILTVIGILLAAAAALMVIFYGGDAFNKGSIGAQANTVQNAGTNIISAVQLHKVENPAIALTDLDDLVTAEYLGELPALTGIAASTGADDVSGTHWEVALTSSQKEDVCARINVNLKNGVVSTVATRPADVKMGCYTDATNGETFFAKL